MRVIACKPSPRADYYKINAFYYTKRREFIQRSSHYKIIGTIVHMHGGVRGGVSIRYYWYFLFVSHIQCNYE